MEPGDMTRVLDGAFAGYEAVVLEVDDAHVSVEVELFGRTTEVRLLRSQVADDGYDPRGDVLEGLLQSVKRRWSVLEEEWWQQTHEPTWDDHLAWRTEQDALQNLAAGEVQRLFESHFGEDAVAQLSPADLRETLEELPPELLVHMRWWATRVADIQGRLEEEPGFDRERLELRQRGHDSKRRAYQDEFRRKHGLNAEEARQRRDAAWARARARHLEIRPAFERAFGLRLPEQTANYWAFWTSLNEVEKEAADWIWRFPAGVMAWFEEDFEARELLEGLDHRLHFRYRPAAPEFVCVMTGDSDGLNYGLVYDDPGQEPAWVASFYARDDPTHGLRAHTILGAYRAVLESHEADAQQYPDPGLDEEQRREQLAKLDELRGALLHFETADRPERGAAYEDAHNIWEETRGRAPTLDGLGVLPPSPIELTRRPEHGYDLHEMYKDAAQRDAWVAQARDALAENDPWPALVVGRDLFYKSWEPELQPTAMELLTAAYEMLGRGALAEIARLHHEHRELRSVDVYQR